MDDYFRGDRSAGITPPDLSKDVAYADHIVKARGKRTQFTSVLKAPGKIRDFGDQIYKLTRPRVDDDGHTVVEHDQLLRALRDQAKESTRERKLKAIQAMRYARKRLEGLVKWSLDTSGVDRKNLLTWAAEKIQPYFQKQ